MGRISIALIGALALLAVSVPTAAQGATYSPSAPGPVYANTNSGSVTKSASDWRMLANGPSGYARLMYRASSSWTAGQTHSFGGRFLVNSTSGYVSLLRADNYSLYGGSGYVFGVSRYNSDRRGRLVVGTYTGSDQIIGSSFAIPVGQWFDLDVTITVGSRITARVNGATVASGTFRVPAGKERISTVRSGIVATGNSGQMDVRQQQFRLN